MSNELNVHNLVLDDNTFEVLPDGDYRFTVASHELGYASSDKLPPNTQQITCHLEIPIIKDGEVKTVTVKNNFNVYKKALFAIRQFAEAIGLCAEKGKFTFDVDKIDGKTGVCSLTTHESANGNEYNHVQNFYPPSKVPAATANDDAWQKKDDFMPAPEDILDDIL